MLAIRFHQYNPNMLFPIIVGYLCYNSSNFFQKLLDANTGLFCLYFFIFAYFIFAQYIYFVVIILI